MSIRYAGFTLAELLIALTVLGVIATFTIPKVLSQQQGARNKAVVKEAAAALENAYLRYRDATGASSGTTMGDVTPYLNYVQFDTSGANPVDNIQTSGSDPCTAAYPCIRFHSGASVTYDAGESFGGTGTTNAVWIHVDPDGVYSGTTNGPGKAVPIFLYYNGFITDQSHLKSGTISSGGSYSSMSAAIPPWFDWN